MLRLVQLDHPTEGRRVAAVEEPDLRLLAGYPTVYHLARAAIDSGRGLADLARASLSSEALAYDPVYEGRTPWRLLPPFDHPDEPGRCLVTGTGLTHKASAENRQAMHAATGTAAGDRPPTDSMKMWLMRGRWCEAALQPLRFGRIFGGGLDGSIRTRRLSWTSRSPT
jgi:hypothetical protein